MKGFVQTLWEPSLVRRVVMALLAAFALVWVALVAVDYSAFKRASESRDGLLMVADTLAAVLDGEDAARAALVMRASETQFNRLRQATKPQPFDHMLFQLARPSGDLVYASDAWAGQAMTPMQADQASLTVNGKRYRVATRATARWRVSVLEPALSSSDALGLISSNLVQSMLIAFLLVLLPLWLAVRRGLGPLRDLVRWVANRAPTDFSPLALDLRYAELRPLEAAFSDLLQQARSGIQSERGFVQDAAHELRTPLAVISAQAHTLAVAQDGQERLEARQALERAVEKASHLVQQLLTLARLEARPPSNRQTVDLAHLVQTSLAQAQARAMARRITLELDAPETLMAQVDVQVLVSALDNLVNNALAYVQEGGCVQVDLSRTDGHIRLTVAHDGPGIVAAERPRLMQRFQRGQQAALAGPGSGLGLAIVAQAAVQLGGGLRVVQGLGGRGIGFQVAWPEDAPV